MMCLRRRSMALRCFRTGGASCLRRGTTRSRCGTWRPVDAATLEGHSGPRLRRPLYFCDDVFVVGQWRCRVSGRAARRVWFGRQDAQGVGRGDRQMRGDAGRALGLGVRCGVRCTFVMMCLRRRSMALPCFRTGVASCLRRTTRRSRCGTWTTGECVATLEGHSSVTCVAASGTCVFVMMCVERCRSMALPCFRRGRPRRVWVVGRGTRRSDAVRLG